MTDAFYSVQQWLFETWVQPLVQHLGLASQSAEAFEGAGWLLAGVLQLLFIGVVFGLLERRWPVEPVSDRRAIRLDFAYTLIHRLGLFRLGLFFTLDPLVDALAAQGRLLGWQPWHLDALWPGVTDIGWVSFLLYLVLFDFAGYWLHRAQHQWRWWWALHALHHSQRQMGKWSDNRNHLLDDFIMAFAFSALALVAGTEPAQFMGIVLVTQLFESLQHANVRLRFGVLERLWVSPHFHRLHHGVSIGHMGHMGGHNFGVLLPCWDALFGSARWHDPVQPTGIADQLKGRDYGSTFWAQQRLGLTRLWQALTAPWTAP
jgi:sterol desaturase/sphingolipid hydroxylase (fatty acid hydroxylase superfamily)